MQVSLKYAQKHLSDLAAASNGEEIEISLPGNPALFLAPRPSEPTSAPPRRPRAELLYAWEGRIALPTDEEWRAMDKELEAEMLRAPRRQSSVSRGHLEGGLTNATRRNPARQPPRPS